MEGGLGLPPAKLIHMSFLFSLPSLHPPASPLPPQLPSSPHSFLIPTYNLILLWSQWVFLSLSNKSEERLGLPHRLLGPIVQQLMTINRENHKGEETLSGDDQKCKGRKGGYEGEW